MKRPLRSAANDIHAERRPRQATSSSAPLSPFSVYCQKQTTGAWVLFSRYPSREEAHSVSRCLSALGQAVRVVAPK